MQGIKIDIGKYLDRNKQDEFEFKTDYENIEDYMFDIDTNELVRLRVQKKINDKQN